MGKYLGVLFIGYHTGATDMRGVLAHTLHGGAISEMRIDRIYFGAYDQKKGSLESIMKIYNEKHYFVPEVYGGINEKDT